MDWMPSTDGIDHINIYSKGETVVGRLLTNFANTPFVLDGYGRFESVEGLWYYAKTGFKHEHLRELSGVRAKTEGKKLERVQCDNFNRIIELGIQAKLRQNPRVLAKLIDTGNLPLTHYYYFGDKSNPKVYRLPQYDWITQINARCRAACILADYYPKGEVDGN